MLEQYYNKETQTLTFPYDFNKELCDLPLNTKVIIFEEDYSKKQHSLFNQPVNNLPNTIKELGFFSNSNIKNNIPEFISNIKILFRNNDEYNQQIDNIPCHIKKIIINKTKVHFLKKIPFGCKIFDENDNEIIFN